MKKTLSYLLLLVMLCCFTACASNASKVKILAETEFDGMKISICYDSTVVNNDGFYYQNDRDGFQYPLYQAIYSSDHSKLLYIDYADAHKVFEGETEALPVKTVRLKTDGVDAAISIYHLDASKECWKIGKNQKEYRILTCVEASNGTSMQCSGGYEISSDEQKALAESWTEISNVDESLSFEVFMMIANNQIFITDHQAVSEVYFSKHELENGDWIVCVEEKDKTYYQLNGEEVTALKKLMKQEKTEN